MASQINDNRGKTFRMPVGILRTIDTTETLHCLSFFKSSDSDNQVLSAPRLGTRRYNYKCQVFSLPFSLSIITFNRHYLMSDPSFEIKNNQDKISIGVNECDSSYEY